MQKTKMYLFCRLYFISELSLSPTLLDQTSTNLLELHFLRLETCQQIDEYFVIMELEDLMAKVHHPFYPWHESKQAESNSHGRSMA